jgi:hypothetical protein
MAATQSSRIRMNFHEETEALINKQINMEFYASYVYLSMVGGRVRPHFRFGSEI